jgi:pyruvate dehydrogenase E2 component (dihydrolipoamide acetyltransferase)
VERQARRQGHPGPAGAKSAPAKAAQNASAPPAKSAGTAVLDRPASGTNGAHAGSHASAGHGAAEEGGRIFASPLAKKIAAAEGVNLSRVQGSGPSGRIIRRDVEAALAAGGVTMAGAPTPAPQAQVAGAPAALQARTVPLSSMRGVIARRLVESKTTIPHYQVTVDADMDALMALRAQLNEQLATQGVKLSVNDFLVRACALAMRDNPFVNSRWVQKGSDLAIDLIERVNVGIAISLPQEKGGGLVVGTVRDADRIGLRAISTESKRLAERARTKGLSIEDMSDSTFTISNLGMFGVSHFTAIINPPNVAILAVGAAIQRPVVKNGQVVPGYVMSMTMSSDHRVIDGAMAAAYLATVRDLLEKPATLLV